MAEQTAEVPAQPAEAPVKKIYSVDIIKLVKTSQIQYGLRHSDYQRYRRYCTRRLQRLRKALKFTHGKGAFQKRAVNPTSVTDSRFIDLTIIKAERAWAYAMQIKQEMEIQTDNTRLRHHLLRRLDKAVKYAALLEAICASCANQQTSLEAEAYSSWLQGVVSLQREQLKTALDKFVKARTIYDQLSKMLDAYHSDVCRERVEEIEPNIRFCNYNLDKQSGAKGSKTSNVSADVASNDPLNQKFNLVKLESQKKVAVAEIEWHGQKIPVTDEKAQSLISSLKDITSEIDATDNFERKMQQYDKLFSTLSDIIRIIKDELAASQKLAGKAKSGKVEEYEQTLQKTVDYATYQKLRAAVNRNLLIAGSIRKSRRPDDMVKLFDGILQSWNELLELVDSKNQAEIEEAKAQISLYKAFRCYWLALSYANASKFAESLALFDKAAARVSQSTKLFGSRADKEATQKLQALSKDIRSAKTKSHARAFEQQIQTSTEKPVAPKKTSLLGSLEEYDASFLADKKLIELPPDYQLVPCKPQFFDMAFNSIAFPNLEDRKKTQKAGLLSYIGWKR